MNGFTSPLQCRSASEPEKLPINLVCKMCIRDRSGDVHEGIKLNENVSANTMFFVDDRYSAKNKILNTTSCISASLNEPGV